LGDRFRLMSVTIYLNALSLIAPGLAGWEESLAVFRGDKKYVREELEKFSPSILPANERRRTTPLIKLALHVAEQCFSSNLNAAKDYASVFATSDGDHHILDKMCKALTLPGHPISPTNFHNSVHNAPAGYWAIAVKAQQSSTSLSACNESFAVGLIETATYAHIEKNPVLFIAYDYPAPAPLDGARHLDAGFAVAMCFTASKTEQSIAALKLQLTQNADYTICHDLNLEQLRLGNPAARSLPLLEQLAKAESASIVIPHVQATGLEIQVTNY